MLGCHEVVDDHANTFIALFHSSGVFSTTRENTYCKIAQHYLYAACNAYTTRQRHSQGTVCCGVGCMWHVGMSRTFSREFSFAMVNTRASMSMYGTQALIS